MIDTAYLLFSLCIFPFISWQHTESGRDYFFILGSCLYAVYMILWGRPFPLDGISISSLCFVLWLALSLLWSKNTGAPLEFIRWLAVIFFFNVCRTVSLPITMTAVFASGVVIACLQIYKMRNPDPIDVTSPNAWHAGIPMAPVLHNPNHTGIFYVLSIFAGLWLLMNGDLYVIPLMLFPVVAVATCGCRTAVGGLFCGLLLVLVMVYGLFPFIMLASPLFVALLGYLVLRVIKIRPRTLLIRLIMWVPALKMIVRKPLFGWGIDSYRSEQAPFSVKMMDKLWFSDAVKKVGTPPPGGFVPGGAFRYASAHRLHNDHLELILEIGIVGYILFCILFTQLAYTPFLVGLMVAVVVDACMFYPIRATHIVVPFMAMVGALNSQKVPILPELLPLSILFAVLAIAYVVKSKLSALRWYDKGCDPTEGAKEQCFSQAVRFDPDNSHYLTMAQRHETDMSRRLDYALTNIYRYDGGNYLYSAWINLAEALCRARGIDKWYVERWAVDKALAIFPDCKPALDLKESIDDMEKYPNGLKPWTE